jgi:LPXTG-site transpeptidase (sortase) family protein
VIIPVGVNPQDLSFEVPPADQVGWYEFGAAPGEAGSAVLAAHIAFNGADGVFRYLENVEIGAVVAIGFDDGTTMRYRIEEVTEYVKEELPESLWKRDGKEQLALITCGGAFNYQLDSYESNTVAIAVPVV